MLDAIRESTVQWIERFRLCKVGVQGALPQSPADYAVVAKHGLNLLRHAPTFVKFGYAIGSEIDDRLDPLPFEKIKSFGAIREGDTPSPFLLNKTVLTDDEWRNFQAMEDCGLMPMKLSIAFCNSMALKLFEEKSACHTAAGQPENRQPIKTSHLQLSELSTAFFATAVNPFEMQKLHGMSGSINRDSVAALLPNTVRLGAVLQMFDDMSDMIKDLRDEAQTGMVTANCLVADIAMSKGLDECMDFVQHKVPDRPQNLPIGHFPVVAQKCWKNLLQEADELASQVTIPSARRNLMQVMHAVSGPFAKAPAAGVRLRANEGSNLTNFGMN